MLIEKLQAELRRARRGGGRSLTDPPHGVESPLHINAPATPKRPGADIREASPECAETLTLAAAARLLREAVKDKSYRAFPLGQEAGHYLRAKRKRLTASSYRDYESCLDKLARYFADLEIGDLEPPVGTQRLEEFLEAQWGESAGRTYNKNLSILRDFFKFQVLRGNLHGDPTLAIERARKRDVYRTTFSNDQVRAIVASQDELRDRVAVRLLLNYGLRKGALKAIQFRHFDHYRKRLTVFTKGEKVRELPIPHPEFWFDLERLILEFGAQPTHYLMQQQQTRRSRYEHGKAVEYRVRRFPSSRWATTACTTGGTAASSGPGSSRRARPAASGCTRPGTPRASACSTRPAT